MGIWVDVYGWPVPPLVLLGCLIAELLYFRGWRILVKEERAKQNAGTGYFPVGQAGSWLWRGFYFLIAVIVLLVGDSVFVDTLSGRYFWVHMIQHLLLLIIIAPLMVAAAPLLPMWLGLPQWVRRGIEACGEFKGGRLLYQVGLRVGHWLRQPAVTCVILIVGTWVWHWPALYDFALTNDAIHDWGEHLTFFAVSVLFWLQVIPSPPLRLQAGYLGRLACVGVAIVQNVVLAVLLGFSQVPLYAPYIHLAQASGGFSALQDQQLGAGIMWTFGDVPFLLAIGVLVQQWLASQSDDTGIAIQPPHRAEG